MAGDEGVQPAGVVASPGVSTESRPDLILGPSHLEFARKSSSREISSLLPTSSLGPAPSLLLRRLLPSYGEARALNLSCTALSAWPGTSLSPVRGAAGRGKATLQLPVIIGSHH